MAAKLKKGDKPPELQGKIALVTGAASGIGRAYAEIMAEHAARVCIFDIDQSGLDETVAAIREATDLPIACGFGISKAEHVRAVVEHADAAIVGSALVRAAREGVEAVGALAKALREALE